jgi:hypothetical protein
MCTGRRNAIRAVRLVLLCLQVDVTMTIGEATLHLAGLFHRGNDFAVKVEMEGQLTSNMLAMSAATAMKLV